MSFANRDAETAQKLSQLIGGDPQVNTAYQQFVQEWGAGDTDAAGRFRRALEIAGVSSADAGQATEYLKRVAVDNGQYR